MSKSIVYKVLWVDEEKNVIDLATEARKHGIIIYQYDCWEQAREILERRFEAFSAIILDGNCVINAGENPNPDFLYQAVREMESIFAKHEESLPWYVLSSGRSEGFDQLISRISMGEREKRTEDWGKVYFPKPDGNDNSSLFELCIAIQHACSQRVKIKVGRLYSGVFEVLKNHFDPQSCNTMLDILVALHYPEENRNFDAVLYFTQLRKILENLFRACNRIGVLPDEVLGQEDKVNLANSSLYLAGREVSLGRKTVRYGKPGDTVFPPVIAQIVKSVLVVANKNSHTTELNPQETTVMRDYYNSLHSNNFLFGYALHLCDVILWFGNFSRQTPPPIQKEIVEPRYTKTAPRPTSSFEGHQEQNGTGKDNVPCYKPRRKFYPSKGNRPAPNRPEKNQQ